MIYVTESLRAFAFPVMTVKQVVQEGGEPSCRSARCPRIPSFPPAAAGGKTDNSENQKVLLLDENVLTDKDIYGTLDNN